ncbi:hypothetical protein F2P56_014546 [Juglans regia]|uniref:Cytochrome b561 and DOMON domain-containing protein At3g61750-like n=2 Tax=Juglans regia TaxID=51240 RepID=A0A833XDU8_JUGRE|nr:cytochrome b561 and DOMON domain-containing protein At3g61750-like [Juglans regia]KAF5464472.1 hypothetical protein F2P56_014546 [Juglans regia]
MANLRSWVPNQLVVVGFCVSILVLELNVPALADHESGNIGGGGGRGEVPELCGTDLSFLPTPYGNLSHVFCKPIWNTFVLRHSQNEDHVINIILSAVYTTGWVGLGFSKDGMMVGSSAMVGWLNRKGHAKIKQYYLQGSKEWQVIPDKGELPLTGIPTYVGIHGAMIHLAYQMKFENQLARQPIILAFGSASPKHSHLPKHDDKTTIMFDFSPGSHVAVASTDFGPMKKNHGILGIIGWGLILPIGAIIPRYFKHKDPLWYYLHSVFQVVGFVIGLAGVVLGRRLYNMIKADFPTHRGIGIFVLVLSILQILAFFLRPNREAKIRKFWNWYHHWVGRLALFFGALNIVLGIQIGGAGNDWKIGYGFLLSVVILTVIVLEVLAWMKRSEKATDMDQSFQMNPVE